MKTDALHNQFNAAYEAEADHIFRFCLIRVSDREQALDITQETFVRLWQNMSTGESISNMRAFLFTVAHNLIIDWYRKKKSTSLEAMADPDTGEPYEPVGDSVGHASQELSAEGRFLIDSIGKLEATYRQAVYLRFVEDLSPPDIAKVLGISTNAASVRITRGIEELRKITGYSLDSEHLT
jgi:RNA polymerase sigma-70 factor (ECF subfamily)